MNRAEALRKGTEHTPGTEERHRGEELSILRRDRGERHTEERRGMLHTEGSGERQ